MAKIIHAMIRVLDLDSSIRFYRDAFGLNEKRRQEMQEATLRPKVLI